LSHGFPQEDSPIPPNLFPLAHLLEFGLDYFQMATSEYKVSDIMAEAKCLKELKQKSPL
jgi:hypothetical protein